jgi:hypothetical protein
MIKKLFFIVKKNFQVISRNKVAFFIVFFAPLIFIALLGLAFNNSGLSGILVGVYSDQQDSVFQNFIDGAGSSDFRIINFNTEDGCIESVKQLRSHLCVIYDAHATGKPLFTYYVDYSNVKLVWVLIGTFTDTADSQSKNIAYDMISSLLGTLQDSIKDIETNSGKFSKMHEDMSNIKSSLSTIDSQVPTIIGIDTSKIDDASRELDLTTQNLKLKRGEFKDNSVKFDEQIEKQEKDIEVYIAQIRRAKNDSLKLKNSLSSSYDYFDCNNFSNADLGPYLEDEDSFVGRLQGTENPTCSLIYTSLIELENDISELEKIESSLLETRKDISTIQDDYSSYEDDIDSMYSDSISSIGRQQSDLTAFKGEIADDSRMINEKNTLLLQKLQNITHSLESSDSQLKEFNGSLSTMKDKLSTLAYGDPDEITSPFNINIKPVSIKSTSLFYMFPSLIIMLICFISLIIASVLEVKENTSPALSRNVIAPVNMLYYLVATYLTSITIIFFEITVISAFAWIFFDIPLTQIPSLAILVIISSLIFSSAGIIIANIMKNEESVILTSIILACIFFLFSNSILPIENMAKSMSIFAMFSPYVISEALIRKTIIFGASVFTINREVLLLFVHTVVLSLVSILIKRFNYNDN